jgi:hypothetical protein
MTRQAISRSSAGMEHNALRARSYSGSERARGRQEASKTDAFRWPKVLIARLQRFHIPKIRQEFLWDDCSAFSHVTY